MRDRRLPRVVAVATVVTACLLSGALTSSATAARGPGRSAVTAVAGSAPAHHGTDEQLPHRTTTVVTPAPITPSAVRFAPEVTSTGISRSEIVWRATWALGHHPASYGGAVTAWGPEGDVPYTADCSGLVSMAWHLPQSLSSANLPSVSVPIGKADLRPGDMLDIPGTHALLFTGWVDDRGTFGYVSYGAYPPVAGRANIAGDVIDGHPGSDYEAFRFTGTSETVTDVVTAATTAPGLLTVSDALGVHTSVPLGTGSSPSVAAMLDGGWVAAAQTSTGTLAIVRNGAVQDTGVPLAAGSSPVVAAATAEDGYRIAYTGSDGTLQVWSSTSGPSDTGRLLRAGTDPAITALAQGGYQVAYTAPDGGLVVVGDAGERATGLAVRSGTRPAITSSPTGYRAVVQGPDGGLDTYDSVDGPTDLAATADPLSSPAIAGLPGGGYRVAFLAPDDELTIVGDGTRTTTGVTGSPGTSPSVAALAAGVRVAVRDTTGVLAVDDAASDTVSRGETLRFGSRPSIAAAPEAVQSFTPPAWLAAVLAAMPSPTSAAPAATSTTGTGSVGASAPGATTDVPTVLPTASPVGLPDDAPTPSASASGTATPSTTPDGMSPTGTASGAEPPATATPQPSSDQSPEPTETPTSTSTASDEPGDAPTADPTPAPTSTGPTVRQP